MPCLLGCLALAVPRLVLFGLWLFTKESLLKAVGTHVKAAAH